MYAKDAYRFKNINIKMLMFKNSQPIHYNIVYNALTATHYSSVVEHWTHGESTTLERNTPKNSLFTFNRNTLKRNQEQNSHSYKDITDEKPIRIRIDIRTRMSMQRTHTKIKWIVIRTEMCMTRSHDKILWIVIRTEM